MPRKIRALGHKYVLLTSSPDFYSAFAPEGEEHPVTDLADEVVTCDTNDLGELIGACAAVKRRRAVDGVLSSCDYYLKAVAEVAAALNLPSSPVAAVTAATNKFLMRRALKEKGVPGPRFFLARSAAEAAAAAEEAGFPLIVKPADMNGSELVQKVNDPDALVKAVEMVNATAVNTRNQARFPGALIEEYLPGEEFSVECCIFDGDVFVLGITDKKLGGRDKVVEVGHMFPADIHPEEASALKNHVKEALLAIGYSNGVAHVEARLTPQGPRIIEINARIGGNYISDLVERVTGISPLTQMIQIALGQPPDLPERLSNQGPESAAIAFVLPLESGILKGYDGEDEMKNSPGVVSGVLASAGKKVASPNNNDCYLGHVICVDNKGLRAGCLAAQALSRLTPIVEKT